MATNDRIGFKEAVAWLAEIVGPEAAYVRLGLVYTLAIGLLSLATPISVQLLINSVANIALPAPLWTLSAVLLVLLLLVAGLSALRVHLMAAFERRVFARIVAEITIRAVHAQNPFFGDANRSDLFNRYFDVSVIQKAVPALVIGAFTIVLQGLVGLVVTSFYHPFFLAFNVTVIAIVIAIWLAWRRGAISGAVALSHAKHNAARWLESVGSSNGFYKSSRHLAFAMDKSDAVTADYVAAHKLYFRYSFAQTLGYLLLYAFASAALLMLGGDLILRRELSIGQLVAAELILASVFYGIAQLGYYLDNFYELVASSEEISLLFSIPQEAPQARGAGAPKDGALRLRNVMFDDAHFDFSVEAGEQLVIVATPGAERKLALVLKRHLNPQRGLISIGGADLGGLDMYLLRSQVLVLDRPSIAEVTIRQYLTMASSQVTAGQMMEALEMVGLQERIAQLQLGLDTQLASTGHPLSLSSMMALRLANAMLVAPKLLMLGQVYDLLPPRRLEAVLTALRARGTTVLLFTRRPEDMTLDGWLHYGLDEQRRFSCLADLQRHLADRGENNALPS
ncbi:hypothetical protein P7B02_03215 [Caulobacter segnis]|uniref:hypothetical protein n=1 Tax=Caulobacter segnis TaxID=88688 RepID=UPI0024100BD4|nr:hypothetical protein [Caulobacter segnis]MDG2520540.1 hypothetical protein [Caulobacter segnis]